MSIRHAIAAVGIGLVFCSNATAGEHQDKLAQCLVKSTTQQDRNDLVQWIFAAMSAHPLTSDFATISKSKRDEITAKATDIFENLLTDSCGIETLNTVKFEGTESLSKAFEALGGVAMEGLMQHPEVDKAVMEMASGVDQSKFDDLIKKHGR